MILPGKTFGLLGGGPLARMLVPAAQALGFRVCTFAPAGARGGTGGDRAFQASYDDTAALQEFARESDVITTVLEDIPADSLAAIAPIVPLLPRAEVLHICQHRQREKAWLRAHGFPHVGYAEALDGDIAAAVAQIGLPCAVKGADFGSDGRGQMKLTTADDLAQAVAIFRGRRCVVEKWCELASEVSVIVARNEHGEVRPFPVSENTHTLHVLDFSIVPARVPEPVAHAAQELATRIAEKLGVVGLIAVEFFVTERGELLVNELAPRPHNSGHWSLDGCETSQFEQHVRAVCGWPLGAVDVREPTVMVNILGDAWRWRDDRVVGEPNWPAIIRAPRTKLRLYGLAEPRIGRKMGHFTVRDRDIATAVARARALQAEL